MSGVLREDELEALVDRALALEEAEHAEEALAHAWRAFDLAPADRRTTRLLERLLQDNANLVTDEHRSALERLLSDPDSDPDALCAAGWRVVLGPSPTPDNPKAMAAALENDTLALQLLRDACVAVLDMELILTKVRRWLLLSGEWRQYPRLTEALFAQARLNGGAWLFDADESAALEQSPFAPAYRPQRDIHRGARFQDNTTQAVADQYAHWPFPVWTRLPSPKPTTLPRVVEKLDAGQTSGLPVDAEILVAGCGTGREAADLARRFPDARVTAIDISSSSLAYAAEHCQDLGIDFHLLDLHEVASLDRRFDFIACSGVLHHLPDPEGGWAKLVEVLNPRGVMKVMLYSRVGRLLVQAAKTHVVDLCDQPVDDDLLRAARRRLIEKAPSLVSGYYDFYSLAGVHDFLMNRHEDLFDVARIGRALDRLDLELLAFKLPTAAETARYRADHPGDPLFRDVRAWGELEKKRPFLFSAMYEFWCRRAA